MFAPRSTYARFVRDDDSDVRPGGVLLRALPQPDQLQHVVHLEQRPHVLLGELSPGRSQPCEEIRRVQERKRRVDVGGGSLHRRVVVRSGPLRGVIGGDRRY